MVDGGSALIDLNHRPFPAESGSFRPGHVISFFPRKSLKTPMAMARMYNLSRGREKMIIGDDNAIYYVGSRNYNT